MSAKTKKATGKVAKRKAPVGRTAGSKRSKEIFAEGIAQGLSQTAAFLRAYPRSRNWTNGTVRSKASNLATDPAVRAHVEALGKVAMEATNITVARTLTEAARLAFFDVRKMFRDDGTPIPVQELDSDTAAAIAGIEVLEQFDGEGGSRKFVGYVKKYRLADKNSAIEKLMKHLNLFEKDNASKQPIFVFAQSVPRNLPDQPAPGPTPGDAKEG